MLNLIYAVFLFVVQTYHTFKKTIQFHMLDVVFVT